MPSVWLGLPLEQLISERISDKSVLFHASIKRNKFKTFQSMAVAKKSNLVWKQINWTELSCVELNWLFNVTINDISVIYVTAHRCAGGLKKKLDLRSGSQRHRHFAGFFNVPVLAPTRDHPFYTVIPTHRPNLVAFYDHAGDTEDTESREEKCWGNSWFWL